MRYSLVVISAVAIAACAGSPAPPDVPPSDVSGFPALTDGPYATHVARGSFPAPPSDIRPWIDADSRFLYALPDVGDIARPVDFEVIAGEWPEEGAVRRLEFSDGHFALERIVENDLPGRFTYQVWDFTSATADNVSYIYGIQELVPSVEGGSDFTWTYNLKPNAGWKRGLVQRFVNKNIQPFLDGSVATVEADAEIAFAKAP